MCPRALISKVETCLRLFLCPLSRNTARLLRKIPDELAKNYQLNLIQITTVGSVPEVRAPIPADLNTSPPLRGPEKVGLQEVGIRSPTQMSSQSGGMQPVLAAGASKALLGHSDAKNIGLLSLVASGFGSQNGQHRGVKQRL
jgi:hypothetical protein